MITQAPIEQRTRLATSSAQPKSDFEKLLDKEQRFVSYVPFGETEPIKLTVPIVQELLCERTKSGKTCSDRDAKKFIVMCQSMRLNPFEKDAFIAGYDTKQFDGSYAPKFSIIIAHQAYLKRADASPDYEGMESGIILRAEDGQLMERETDFVMPEETKLVVGGWAKIYRKNKRPTYRRCSVAARKPDYDSRFWSEDKTPEMVCKCAEMDALRSTFPTLIGGLVGGDLDVTDRFVQPSNGRGGSSLVETVSSSPTPKREDKPAEPAELSAEGADLGPQRETKPAKPEAGEKSKSSQLEEFVTSNGFTFADLMQYGAKEELIPGADSIPSFADIPEKLAGRLLNAKAGLLAGLKQMKGGA